MTREQISELKEIHDANDRQKERGIENGLLYKLKKKKKTHSSFLNFIFT